MKVLVAGGAGYIGSHTVKALLGAGFETVVLDDLSTGRRELVVPGLPFRRRPTCWTGTPCGASSGENGDIAAVLHFASLIQVGESYLDPRKYYRHNLGTSLNLLEAMLEAGIGRFVFSSSAAVYGAPRGPAHPRGASPRARQSLRRHQGHGRAHPGGLRQGPRPALRHPPLFQRRGGRPGRGPRRAARPRDPPHPQHPPRRPGEEAAPSASSGPISRRRTGRPSGITSTSRTWPTPMSSPSVTFSAGGPSEAVNLGTNRGYSVLEVVRAAEEVVGRKVPVELLPRREGDVPGAPGLPGKGPPPPRLGARTIRYRDDPPDGLGLAPEKRLTALRPGWYK